MYWLTVMTAADLNGKALKPNSVLPAQPRELTGNVRDWFMKHLKGNYSPQELVETKIELQIMMLMLPHIDWMCKTEMA